MKNDYQPVSLVLRLTEFHLVRIAPLSIRWKALNLNHGLAMHYAAAGDRLT